MGTHNVKHSDFFLERDTALLLIEEFQCVLTGSVCVVGGQMKMT